MAKSKKAKIEDYRQLDEQGLGDRLASESLQLKKSRFAHAVNPIENPMTIRQMRRNIARFKTEQRKRVLGS